MSKAGPGHHANVAATGLSRLRTCVKHRYAGFIPRNRRGWSKGCDNLANPVNTSRLAPVQVHRRDPGLEVYGKQESWAGLLMGPGPSLIRDPRAVDSGLFDLNRGDRHSTDLDLGREPTPG